MQRRKGFTLIELLVVIAIVAILAAILFPVFTSAKDKGRQATCFSNMKQLGLAMMSYADDNQGAYPFHYNLSNIHDWYHFTWRERIQPYCKSKSIMACPVKIANTDRAKAHQFGDAVGKLPAHYGMGVGMTTTQGFGAIKTTSTFISDVGIPSQTILIAENSDGDWSAEPVHNDTKFGMGIEGQGYAYHMGGSNYVFCDGHAKFLTVEASEEMKNGLTLYWWRPKKI